MRPKAGTKTKNPAGRASGVFRHGGCCAAFLVIVMGFVVFAPAAKPGDDLLFHRLSDSTIGAVRFHGRVRDGIGWVTDAKVTKL